MALSRVKNWIAGETLTASDQNAEFSNIIDNALSLISPLTGTLDANGNEIVLDADADSSITADTDDRIDLKLSGADLFRFDGTATTPVNGLDFIARASGSPASIQAQGSDSNVAIDIRDDNANELMVFSAVASAINEITVTNAAAGGEPIISATGGDTDISIELTPKGAGVLDLTLGPLNENKGANVTSATTTDIGAATGNFIDVTATNTITGLGTVKAGSRRVVQFDDALTLTHNGTSLILPSGANITTATGDVAEFLSLGSGNWLCSYYTKASGAPLTETATKEFFITPIVREATTHPWTAGEGVFTLTNLTSAEACSFHFFIPNDFTTLTSAVVVVIPDASETIQWDSNTEFGANGEQHDANTDSDADRQLAVTNTELSECAVSASLTSIAAGDYVALEFHSDTTNIRVIGLRIKYA